MQDTWHRSEEEGESSPHHIRFHLPVGGTKLPETLLPFLFVVKHDKCITYVLIKIYYTYNESWLK